MAQDERLSGALQENILTLLCFDDENCKILRAALTPQLFESSVFREVAGHAIDFIDQYGETIKDHLPDHLESILEGDDARKAASYKRLVDNLFQSRDSVNSAYVIQQLHKFVRLQTFKSGLIRAVEYVEDGKIDEAEVEMTKAMNTQSVAFEAGLSLSNAEDVVAIFDNPEEEGFELGIAELDRLGIQPRRKEMLTFMAPRGRGKSWFITHAAKQALLNRWSCVIITLEMSEKRYAARMLQSFFAISRRDAEVRVTKLVHGRDGELNDLVQEVITRDTMKDEDMRGKLQKRAKREFIRRRPFRIKEFPPGTLTLAQLRAYLDGLERFEGFTPDVLLIDYPDLMQLDVKNLRMEIGQTFMGIRAIGVERNCATIVVTQGNRESERATTVTGDMAAEDISKLAISDVFLTYSQTIAEKGLGLARILVDKARNEDSKMSVLITQAYAIGQFCLDSVKLKANEYWSFMKDREETDERPARRRTDRRASDD